ncbi:MAG: type II toxin-antitoxin system RelE/ParE family toxin [Polaromonas sp.]|uniref:type II toxin-antitoxin system RelE/ParE family toxin n=1 Tax=Polaromonas sp. TaxID=1869339 RepID=UPI0027309DCE|nr:type II toxin-antitoxin system RelE/ParE family toxin [Polaromonas sp.]MDP2256287.1 type II toxin-antitoxin system RelE/ParE family toxin [Polaromonas sp.]
MNFRVRLTLEAAKDLEQLFDFVLERELQRNDGDLELAERALQAIKNGISSLRTSPFTCRKASQSPFMRELVIPFGRAGYVALFEIVDSENVVIAAVRHQLEDDYH